MPLPGGDIPSEEEVARRLGVSREAVELCRAADVVDLHLESFVWTRVFGYDLASRHGTGVLGGRYYSQADLPRLLDGGTTGAFFSVATNPFRRPGRRLPTLVANLARLRAVLQRHPRAAVVSDVAGYRRARAAGRLACFLAVQGGDALAGAERDPELIPEELSRVTLVHLLRSRLGSPSAPLGGRRGLTAAGRDLVAALDHRRVLVDLAHISRRGFWQALTAHDRDLPAVVSHTGVRAARESWRNLDDDQIRAVADLGGVVGVMLHRGFLEQRPFSDGAAAAVRHLEHVVRVGGEGTAALGTDWDGLIVPPRDLPSAAHLPVLVQRMLDRRSSPERIGSILGGNALRVMTRLRPG